MDSLNWTHSSAAYMRRWTGLLLVQVMACSLFGSKPLPEPMLAYCQLDSCEQISVKFESEFYHFHQGHHDYNPSNGGKNDMPYVISLRGYRICPSDLSTATFFVYLPGGNVWNPVGYGTKICKIHCWLRAIFYHCFRLACSMLPANQKLC